MGNTLECFPSKSRRTKKVRTEHSALKVFVVLKHVFRHLSESELRAARLVNRIWNFTTVSELMARKCRLPAIKLYSSPSNRLLDRDYNLYLDFENSRRRLWVDLYGTECPLIEFRHLHFFYPEKNQALLKIIQSPWLSSVTSLSLSTYTETCEEFVISWFLPALPNLESLSCFIKPEVNLQSTLSDFVGPDPAQTSDRNIAGLASVKSMHERRDTRLSTKLHSLSICFEEACSFPLILLDVLPELQDLKLEFSNITSLMRSVETFAPVALPREIDSLQITLTRKPNLQEQVEEAELNAEAFAAANAKLCNLFRIRQSLTVVSMIPAAHFLNFLKEVTSTGPKTIKFEIATPCYIGYENEYLKEFITYLVGDILFKFPELDSLHLQYLQHRSKTRFPMHILRNERNLNFLDPALEQKVKQLHFTNVSVEPIIPNDMYLAVPDLGDAYDTTLDLTVSWFKGVVELVVQVSGIMDCLGVIVVAGAKLKSVKKLVLRGPDSFKLKNYPKVFYPVIGYLRTMESEPLIDYEGLQGMTSLEVLKIEQFGVGFHPLVIPEIHAMRRLKSIQLDADFNQVTPAENPRLKSHIENVVLQGKVSSTWPSSIGHVQITSF